MCGIFAVLSRGSGLADSYRPMLDMIAHRGPDGSGVSLVSVDGGDGTALPDRAWLGHRRLSIIDTTDGGAQPMASPDGRYIITFNGEIYNYLELREECRASGVSFSTGSDTEVLLAAWSLWGEAALDKLTGMFAFVLVDRSEAQAWIVRDNFGIKPLHYAVTDHRLFVSSEIGPILATRAVPFAPDPTQSFEYLRFGASVAETETLIPGIRRLPPAGLMRIDLRSGAVDAPRRFWRLKMTPRRIGFDDAVDECRARFLANIRLHLRSDVPVGTALSGGLDSSSIACAVRHIEPDLPLNSFSFVSSDPGQSEEHWIDIVNGATGATAHKIVPAPGELASDLEDLVRAQGEPFGSASIYAQYRVFRAAREAGVPVMLDGQGADELLGGYWPYVGTLGASFVRAGRLDRAARLLLGSGIPRSSRRVVAANLIQSLLPAALQRGFRTAVGRQLFPPFLNRDWFESARWRAAAAASLGDHRSVHAHLLDTVERTSLPTLLRIADRSSMASSVESRVPFLTADFAEFVLSLPADYLISPQGHRKHVFAEAMRGILPDQIRQRRDKIGFTADDAVWLRTNWDAFARYYDEIAAAPQFDTDRTMAYLNAFRDRRGGNPHMVWRIFIFAIWQAQMRARAA